MIVLFLMWFQFPCCFFRTHKILREITRN